MANIIGVRFKEAGKIYFLIQMESKLKRRHVIVETSLGMEYCLSLLPPNRQLPQEKIVAPFKKIITNYLNKC